MSEYLLHFNIRDKFGDSTGGYWPHDTLEDAIEFQGRLAATCAKGEKLFESSILKVTKIDSLNLTVDSRMKNVVALPDGFFGMTGNSELRIKE